MGSIYRHAVLTIGATIAESVKTSFLDKSEQHSIVNYLGFLKVILSVSHKACTEVSDIQSTSIS